MSNRQFFVAAFSRPIAYLSASPLRKKFASGLFWAIGSKIWLTLLNLLLNVTLVRIMPPQDVGGFYLILSIWNTLGAFTTFGLQKGTIKLIAEARALYPARTAGVAVRILGFTGLITMLGGLLFLRMRSWLAEQVFHFPYLKDALLLLLIWVLFANLQRVIAEVFRGLQDFRWANLLGTQQAATRTLFAVSVVSIWLTVRHATLSQVVLLYVVANGLTFLLAAGVFFYRVKGSAIFHIPFSWKRLINLAWPFWVSSLGFLARKQADVLILGMFRPADEVALYGIAVRLTQLASILLLIINGVLPPFIVDLYAKGRKAQLERLLRMASSGAFLLALVIFMGFAIFGSLLLSKLFGVYYMGAYIPALILLVGMVINVATGSCVWVLNMTGYEKTNMAISLVSGVAQVALMYILAGKFGVLGVSLAVSGVLIVQMLFTSLYVWRVIGVRTWPYCPGRVWRSLLTFRNLGQSQG